MKKVDPNEIHALFNLRDDFQEQEFWVYTLDRFKVDSIKAWIVRAYETLPHSTAWNESTKLLDKLEKKHIITLGENAEIYDFLVEFDIELGRKGGLI